MTAIIVPWRDRGDPWRRRNLEIVLTHLASIDIAPVIVTPDGRSGSAPFNRSAAYNRGVQENPGAGVYVFHEADMIIPPDQLEQAISDTAALGLVVPFDTYNYLSHIETETIHTGGPLKGIPEFVMVGRAVGAVNVISAETMAAVGQWDEMFQGWGYDDRAMARAFEVATGTPTRLIPGPGMHLWHTPGWSIESRFRGGAEIPEHEHAATVANERRYGLYRQAKTAQRICQLTSGCR